jgi:hypothetical protein
MHAHPTRMILEVDVERLVQRLLQVRRLVAFHDGDSDVALGALDVPAPHTAFFVPVHFSHDDALRRDSTYTLGGE